MHKIWFRKLLLSYLPVFFVVTTILFVVFFQTLNEQTRKDAIKANAFLAEHVVSYVDGSLKSVSYQVINDILTEPVVGAFFDANKAGVYGNIQAIKAMDDLKFSHPMIDSVYFVRLGDGFVLGDGSGKLDEFPDKPLIDRYARREASAKWTGARAYRAYSDVESTDVITLVQSVPYYSSSTKGYYVVNVSLAKLGRTLTQMYNQDTSYVSILDGTGRSLFGGTGEGEPGQRLSRFTSPYTGWQVESGSVEKGLLRLTMDVYGIWFTTALLAVLLGIVWVGYVTRRNYRPIEQIVSLIQTSSLVQPESERAKHNEIGFIHSALTQLMDETRKVQRENAEHAIMRRRHRYQEALEGAAAMTEAEWQSEIDTQQLATDGKKAFVLVMEIDRYGAFLQSHHPHDQSIYKFLLASIVQETAQQHEAAIWAEWTADRRLSAVVWLSQERRFRESRHSIAQSIVQWVNTNLRFTVTIGCDGEADSLEAIRVAYKAAGQLLSYKAIQGTARVIELELTGRSQASMTEYYATIHALAMALRCSDPSWSRHLDQLFRHMKEDVCSRGEIESLLQFQQHHLGRAFRELSKEYGSVWQEMERGLRDLEQQWETAEELHEGCGRIYASAAASMQLLRDSHRNRGVILDIRSFIEAQYANPELSLEFLSEKFELQAKSISKLFKEEFGENFVDFLIGLRIQNAKRRLVETDTSLQQISQDVGYFNYNSFNRAFKNNVGVSPSDYRRQTAAVHTIQAANP
ncbi:AraC family transcriptional regulator [Paenibacillus methanolicus]|uniref:Helix-turn-helix protein n=1 Tax=Paenibacillus methanolicus TaxID=582686 RepID=A0A5S5CLG6_9BACL|nr:AraC family transcriptional regulator [Paenibacillus methanolicus]TYP79228.1 helix-turn-helix protein [Paenibacillus methanolicus]